MSTEIANVGASKYGMDVFSKLSAASAFLPYLRLYDPSTKDVKQRKVDGGTFGVVKNRKIVPLGLQFHAYVLDWRPKVMLFSGPEGNPVAHYDPTSKAFQEGMRLADVEDSGWGSGPEFLLYVPDVEYCTFFMNNTTMKNEASNLLPMIGKAVTFESVYIEKGKRSWFGPRCVECSVPMPTLDVELRDTVVHNFRNPKDSVVTKDAPADAQRADR